jgi:hypothetical protein
MLLVILGAGSSFDSHPTSLPRQHTGVDNARPPLAAGLFDEARFGEIGRSHPAAVPLFTRLRQAPNQGRSIEQELELIADESGQHPRLRRQLLALRGYLADVIRASQNTWLGVTRDITTFLGLLAEIDNWADETKSEVCFVTFNYDTLLEEALTREIGLTFSDMDSYVTHARYRLFKVHGSIDWWRLVTNVSGTPENSAADIEFTDSYVVGRKKPQYPQSGTDHVQAIAIPTETKSAFECPAEHMTRLRQVLPQTDRTLPIGWRGAEQHFLAEWKAHSPDGIGLLQVVDGGAASASLQNLQVGLGNKLDRARIDTYDGGFTQFLSQGGIGSFLGAAAVK